MAQATIGNQATTSPDGNDQAPYRSLFVRQIPEWVWLRLHFLALEKRSRLQPLIVTILQEYLAAQGTVEGSTAPNCGSVVPLEGGV